MKNTLVLPVAQDLDGVADVHDDGVGNAFRRHPFALVEELQAGHHVVQNESERAHVGVSFNAEGKLRLRADGIVVDFHLEKKFFQAADFLL